MESYVTGHLAVSWTALACAMYLVRLSIYRGMYMGVCCFHALTNVGRHALVYCIKEQEVHVHTREGRCAIVFIGTI